MTPDPKPTTIKNAKYLLWLRTQACVFCKQYANDNMDVVPAHKHGGGVAMKTDDTLALPLCKAHHTDDDVSDHKSHALLWGTIWARYGKTRDELCTEHWERYQKEMSDEI